MRPFSTCSTPDCGGMANRTGRCPSCIVRESRTAEDKAVSAERVRIFKTVARGFPRTDGSGCVKATV